MAQQPIVRILFDQSIKELGLKLGEVERGDEINNKLHHTLSSQIGDFYSPYEKECLYFIKTNVAIAQEKILTNHAATFRNLAK